jgi:hypothetical protein
MEPCSRQGDDDSLSTEERLRQVTLLCVESLVRRGLDAATVRSMVLRMAARAIEEQATDLYQEETHTAIVQRTIELVLAQGRLAAD